MISLTINGCEIQVEEGTTILMAAQKMGIKIPTLCYHKALLPYGACRLCLVEVHSNGTSSIQASCTYPALSGLSIQTDSERVIKTRRVMMELLLARCPDSEYIKNMAKEMGIERSRVTLKSRDCILCGLCVRVCQERMDIGAIGFASRGSKREVKTPFEVTSEICQTCGACAFICPTGAIKLEDITKRKPVPILSEYNMGLISRTPVYIPYPQAVPNRATIDEDYCVRLIRDKCGICEEFCEAEAINYEQKDKEIELQVGSIILSPGYELFDANIKKELGYDRYPNVITSLEFERILSASGPYAGKVLRPSDKLPPAKIAFIQCVGSRDCDRVYCSTVCCMYATKEAIIAKEHAPEVECKIFFTDLRAFGKGFDAYYERAKNIGVKYIRCRPSSIKEIPRSKSLKIQYQADNGEMVNEEFDMVVLSTGFQPPRIAKDINEKLGIDLNEFGFCNTDLFKPVESNREGIFVCGPFVEPKDIPETVTQASGAAVKALTLLSEVRGSLIKPREYPPEIDVQEKKPRIGVFVCHCGTNIAGAVNVLKVVEYAKTLSDVVYAENNLYTCSNDTQERIKQLIKEHDLNRVVVASCTPRTHEPLFRNTIREAGLNPYLFEMANIRDQCSWVHMHEIDKATRKAQDLVRMAVAKARMIEPLKKGSVKVNKAALVIGGGLSGMIAAMELADQGFDVHLVEKEKELGGNLRKIHFLLDGEDPQKELRSLIEKVKKNDRIRLYADSTISGIEGSLGNFKTKVKSNDNGGEKEFSHGVVIVATGGREHEPEEYFYGKSNNILTQLELENKLINGNFNGRSVAMIQCVGSRDEIRPYCSRVCCSEAIKNALKIKEICPEINVYIIYRDIRTYGFREYYYRKAREKGVIFIRYDEDKKPNVTAENGIVNISVIDPILNLPISIKADALILSAATIPHPGNKEIARMLKVPLNQEDFFLEAHMKLRPVDFSTEGVFLCGLAHSAKSIEESIAQALGAAARASTILTRDNIELEANISYVVDENCDGCAYCIDPCPYKALTLIEYKRNGAIKKTVELNESACKGCGVCQATCPKKGIFVRGFKIEQIAAMVTAALEGI